MKSESKIKDCEEILNRLKIIIENLLKVSQDKNSLRIPEINLNTELVDDLGLDSVEMLDLTTAIAEEFKIDANVPEMFNIKKVGEIVKFILTATNKN